MNSKDSDEGENAEWWGLITEISLTFAKDVFIAGKSEFSVHEQYIQSEFTCELLPDSPSTLEFVSCCLFLCLSV